MDEFLTKDFGKLLKRNALSVRRQINNKNTNVMRVYDLNIEQLPVTVDLYGNWVRLTDYSDGSLNDDDIAQLLDITSRMLYIESEKVVYHKREKREEKNQHTLQNEKSVIVEVKEGNLLFDVDLTKRIDTGLFLDQANAREMVRNLSKDLRVLNLFSYTGSFSVYAAAGGAKSVTSVDLSTTYTIWAKRNLAKNGFEGAAYECITEDAKNFIIEAIKDKKRFDLIIFDPPSFSNSRKTENDFDVQLDYITYLQLLSQILEQKGIVLFSTNLKSFRFDKRKLLAFDVREITKDICRAGFSAKRSSLRSWILSKKDKDFNIEDMLTLNWDEDSPPKRKQPNKDNQKSTNRRKEGSRSYEGRAKRDTRSFERRDDDKRRPYDDRPRRDDRGARSFERRDDNRRRPYDDRPRRDDRGARSFERRDDDRRRPYDDRPRRDDRGARSFERREDDRRRPYDDRPRRDDRGARSFERRDDDRRRPYDDRPRRDDRGARSFERRDDDRRRPYDDRPRRDDRGARSFERRDDDRRRPYDDRPRRDDRRSDRSSDGGQRGEPRRPRGDFNESGKKERSQGKPKPYGYDRFKPARTRGGDDEYHLRKIDEDKDK
jgi:23S rRNA (guanine2445-N2)-methyltransferase / 23S rRNA (guanine2069-N7)-methyltransferase